MENLKSHDLYETNDPNAPDSIKDSNGEVVLGLCRKCGRGESELTEPCTQQATSRRATFIWIDDSDPQAALAEVMSGSPLAAQIAAAPRRHDNDYPLWQGPCGEGPLGGITQSMLVRFLSCRERFRLKYILGLEPHDKWNHRIGYGNMWHTCEEALAKRYTLEPADKKPYIFDELYLHMEAQVKRYPHQRDEIVKWYNVCRIQFPEYVKYWAEHPDVKNRTPLLQEHVFDVPYTLPSGRVVRLRGKWDSVDLIEPGQCECGADRSGPSAEAHKDSCPAKGPWTFRDGRLHGGIYLQENKTKGELDEMQIERQLKFDLQTMIYLIALESWVNEHCRDDPGLAEQFSHPILGVRYNAVRRPLSGGVGNIKPHAAKFTKNTTKPAETDEEFYERLRRDYLAADPGHWFFRVRAEVSDQDIKVFRNTCLTPILEHLCCWYETTTGHPCHIPPYAQNYRTPFGVYSALEEGGATEYDAYLVSGSETGLRRTDTLFPELQ